MRFLRGMLVKHGDKTYCWEAWHLRLNEKELDIMNPSFPVPEPNWSLANLAFVNLLAIPSGYRRDFQWFN